MVRQVGSLTLHKLVGDNMVMQEDGPTCTHEKRSLAPCKWGETWVRCTEGRLVGFE